MDLKRLDTVKSFLLAIPAALALSAAGAVPLASAGAQGSPPSSPTAGGQQAPANGGTPAGGASPTTDPTSADGLVVPTGLLVHQVGSVHGTLGPDGANAPVTIERLDPISSDWTPIATATAGPDGAFTARWRADHIGKFTVRAIRGGKSASASQQSPAPSAQLTVYRPAVATWFGPGFYGQRTACGEIMSATLLGVAHRSLPCGTLVDISYGGHSITVPVVDRGPYVHGVSWDLTTATAQALNFDETARIGALALRGATATPTAPVNTTRATSATGGQAAN